MSADLVSLADKALDRTKAGKIKWVESGSDAFTASLGDVSIGIYKGQGSGGAFRFAVLNKDGAVVESMVSSVLDAIGGSVPSGTLVAYKVFPALFEAARRKALRIDEILNIAEAKLDALL